MNQQKRILVNFASGGRENYIRGSQRLFDSALEVGLDADMLICSPDLQDSGDYTVSNNMTLFLRKRWPVSKEFGECPLHSDAPYGFKSYIIQEAIDMGYEKVMWGDSSLILLKNPEPYWAISEEVGAVLMDNPGCPEGTWTADDCLEHMGCTPEFANSFWEIDAFMMIYNFKCTVAQELFNEYFLHSRDGVCLKGAKGSTRPEFRAHRHDQSIASYFAKIKAVSPISYGAWSYESDIVSGKYKPTFAKVGTSGSSFDTKYWINYYKLINTLKGE